MNAFQMFGVVKSVLIAPKPDSHISTPAKKVAFVEGYGVRFDRHWGPGFLTVRDKVALGHGFIKDSLVANIRQVSLVSIEEVSGIATSMGIPGIGEGLFGENLIVSGIPNFSLLPAGTRLFFRGSEGALRSAILYITGPNNPCIIVGNAIQNAFTDKEGLVKSFVDHAKDRRGLVGLVYCTGSVKEGDTIIVEVPKQVIYDPNAQA